MTHQDHDAFPFRSRWEKVCALLDPTTPIRRHQIDTTYNGTLIKRVWLLREWRNYDNGTAVWAKEYGKEGYDLRSFNTAERNILEALKRLPNCYQLVENRDLGSKLVPPSGTQGQPTGSFLAMTHMGPTVADWLSWPVRMGLERKRLNTLCTLPGNFVRLALAGLRALNEIHQNGLVHMDFHLKNVCLAPQGQPTPFKDGDDEFLKIKLDWHTLKTIDFGFSIARGKSPYTLLPLLCDATPAAQALIAEVTEIGRTRFERFTAAERKRFNAGKFEDLQHDHSFWTTQFSDRPLDRLCAIDWREDCYQFGKQLQAIRAQAGLLELLDQDGYRLQKAESLNFAIKQLPETLIALGTSVTAYPPLGSAEADALEQQRKDTCRSYIRQLETALENMPSAWTTDEVLIFRSDIAPQAHTQPKPKPTAIRPPRRFPWKGAAAIAGAALFFAYLASLQTWNRSPENATVTCWKNGNWQAGCGFAAFAGGPVFRVVGGRLNFTMGSPASDVNRDNNEDPPHPVSFERRFALAETEITVAQYLACVDEGGCNEPAWSQTHIPDNPITGVSWINAQQYVQWLSKKSGHTYTLPTEAQWEYAARGGQSTRWYFGDNESQLKDHAWYGANSRDKLHPVGSTPKNTHPWGLKDMAGNAWEWVEDCWHNSYQNAPSNGDKPWEDANGGNCVERVVRGGSHGYGALDTRAAYRYRDTAFNRFRVSFRPARMLP